MRSSRLFPLAMLASLSVACGDDGQGTYIRPFQAIGGLALTTLPLTVGQSHTVKLRLSQNVSDKSYVDVSNQYEDMVKVSPMVLTFKEGQGTDGLDVTITGQKSTPAGGGGVPIVFQLRDSSAKRELLVEVREQGEGSDGGPAPDVSAPQPDAGTPQPDSAPVDAPMTAPEAAVGDA